MKAGARESGIPVLYWDGDCGFCRRWVDRWRDRTGAAVEYRTLQTAPAEVQAAAGGEPFQRIVLQHADASLTTGALAAFESLATVSPAAALARRLHQSAPLFARTSEWAYRQVAHRRPLGAFVTNLLWGADTRVPRYEISGYLFPRLMGLIFLCAFLSLWVQIDGLSGSRGILPVADSLESVRQHFAGTGAPWQAWWQIPSVLWFGADDTMLHVWLALGVTASLLLLLGVLPAATALVAWAVYLSFAAAVPVFLNYQWDALLLEAGLLVVLYVPWRRYLAAGRAAPTRLGRLLVWWLLFRLMFESGIVKLYGFDATGYNAWLAGTALDYHYFTQPIPVWTSWWFAQLPGWFHRLSLLGVFVIELIMPFFIFGPRRLRLIAAAGFAGLMVLIILSGHYGFFNLLTLVLCLSLLDDSLWPRRWRTRFDGPAAPPAPAAPLWRKALLPALAAVIFVATTLQLLLVLRALPPAAVYPLLQPVLPLRSLNSYGLFSVMTTERPEITIEASRDGIQWEPYRFRYKMDATDHRLPFFLPHMPRLDWQMWFAALEFRASGHPPAWIMPFLGRLQERSPAVTGLLAPGGAAESGQIFFRLRLDNLTFTSPSERRSAGRLWHSEPLPAYTIEGTLQPR